VISLAAGYLLSFLTTRGHDLSRLMITVGVCALLAEAANRMANITGGADGLQGVTMWPLLGRFEFDLFGKTAFAYCYLVVLVLFLGVRVIVASPFGLALRGIQQNRKRMVASGSPVEGRLRVAYALSAALAGVAGALLAQTTQFVGLDVLGVDRSAEVLIGCDARTRARGSLGFARQKRGGQDFAARDAHGRHAIACRFDSTRRRVHRIAAAL
jgi:branched-chain amino acid transport system permease protein